MNELTVPLKTKRIFAAARIQFLAGLIACLALSAQAAVQVVRFDPPRQISAYDQPQNFYFNVLGADLDANGEVDFRLAYGLGAMSAYFNAPVRFGQHVAQPNVIGRGGPVAGVPLNSVIGTNITSPTNFYVWSPGYTNSYDLTQPLGDHEATVIIANLGIPVLPGPVISFSSNGTLVTNVIIYPIPIVSGDVVGKDAVMALEFYVDGQPHYGYIHCDFRAGASGLVYGWAYETEPNVAITAESLAPQSPFAGPQAQEHSGVVGVIDQGNLSGWTVSVSTSRGNFVTSVQTDEQGFFKVNLKPGVYRLQSQSRPGSGPLISNVVVEGVSKTVVVTRDHFTFIELVNKIRFIPLARAAQ